MKVMVANRYTAMTDMEIRSLPQRLAGLGGTEQLVSLMIDMDYLEALGALTGSVTVGKQLAFAVRTVPRHTAGHTILANLSAAYHRLMHTWRDTSLPLLQQLYADLAEVPELTEWLAATRTLYTRRRAWLRRTTPPFQCGRGVVTCVGHSQQINSLHYSNDGSRIVTCSADHTCRVWDATTTECLFILHGHEEAVFQAQFLSQDQNILSLAHDGTCRLWDARTGRCLHVFTECGEDLQSVTCSSATHRFATGGASGPVRVWDAMTRQCIRELACATTEKPSLLMSPDGRRIITAFTNEQCRLHCIDAPDEERVLGSVWGPFIYGQWSSDGQKVALAHNDERCYVYDVRSLRLLCSVRSDDLEIRAACFMESDRQIRTISGSGALTTWSIRGGRAVNKMPGYTDQCHHVAFAPNGTTVAEAQGNNVMLWSINRESYRQRPLFGYDGDFRYGRLSRNHKLLLLGNAKCHIVETKDGYSIATINPGRIPVSAWFTENGRCVRGLTEDGHMEEWDAITGQHRCTVGSVVPVRRRERRCTDYSGLMKGIPEHIRQDPFKMSALSRAQSVGTKNDVAFASVSPNGKLCAVVTMRGRCLVADTKTCETRHELGNRGNRIEEAVFSPDSKQLLTTNNHHRCMLWDTTAGRAIAQVGGRNAKHRALTYSPDGRLLACVSTRGRCSVVDGRTGGVIATFDHERAGWIGFSPDVRWVLTIGSDHTCKLWSTYTGEPLLGAVFDDCSKAAVIHPNGRRVFVSCDSDRPLILELEGIRHLHSKRRVKSQRSTRDLVSLFRWSHLPR